MMGALRNASVSWGLGLLLALSAAGLLAAPAIVLTGDFEPLTGPDTPLRANERISFIGDSITMQGGFIDLLRQAFQKSSSTRGLSVQCFQHGLNGGRVDTIEKGVTPWGKQEPFEALLKKDQPTVVVLYLGVNDATHADAESPQAFEAGLASLVRQAKQTGAAVVLATPALAGEKRNGGNPQDAKLDQYAELTRKVATAEQVMLCDLRKACLAHLAENNASDRPRGVLTYDGIHLSPRGNQLVAEEFCKSLAQAVKGRK
jgi:lysophospholipase L1-like esterase